MKNLLLFFLITSNVCFGQAPPNDLIANATEITAFTFTDVVAGTPTAQETPVNTCLDSDTVGVVYYKYTATSNTFIAVTGLRDGELLPATNTFSDNAGSVTVFTATNNTATNESELTQITVCGQADGSNENLTIKAGNRNRTFEVTQGQTYYIQFVSNASFTTFQAQEVTPLSTSERDALVAFYNSTNGDNWLSNEFWTTSAPVDSWHSLSTYIIDGQEHVSDFNFLGNNTVGPIPESIGDLSNLRTFRFQDQFGSPALNGALPSGLFDITTLEVIQINTSNISSFPESFGNADSLQRITLIRCPLIENIPSNIVDLTNLSTLQVSESELSGMVPDLSSLPNLSALTITFNNYTFDDLAENFENNNLIETFNYTPQFTTDEEIEINIAEGEDVTFIINEDDLNRKFGGNLFQWFKDDVAISGATNSSYTLTNVQAADTGNYRCDITNAALPGLTIQRPNIFLDVGNLGIDEVSQVSINLFPNPSSDVLNIEMDDLSYTKATLHDITGKLINTFNLDTKTSIISIAQLKSGIYLLTLSNGTDKLVKRIIKK